MSDKPIQRGDLVIVVRPNPCCGRTRTLGRIFTVAGFYGGEVECPGCGCVHTETCAKFDGESFVMRLSRLKRLDPGNLSEDVPTGEGITA